MRRGRPITQLELTPEERASLERLVRRGKTAQQLALRAQIVLRCSEGVSIEQVAHVLAVNRKTVGKWRARFGERRLAGLVDEPRPCAPCTTRPTRPAARRSSCPSPSRPARPWASIASGSPTSCA